MPHFREGFRWSRTSFSSDCNACREAIPSWCLSVEILAKDCRMCASQSPTTASQSKVAKDLSAIYIHAAHALGLFNTQPKVPAIPFYSLAASYWTSTVQTLNGPETRMYLTIDAPSIFLPQITKTINSAPPPPSVEGPGLQHSVELTFWHRQTEDSHPPPIDKPNCEQHLHLHTTSKTRVTKDPWTPFSHTIRVRIPVCSMKGKFCQPLLKGTCRS